MPHNMPLALRRTITMILAGGEGSRLYPLTTPRSKPSVPFGGNYRIIDVTLSNCINSGFRRIYMLTQYKSQSLDEHVHKGWDIFSHELNEFIYTVPPQRRRHDKWYEGTADAIWHNVNLLEKNPADYVLILSGDHIYKMDYSRLLEAHLDKGADLTVPAFPVTKQDASRFGVLEIDDDGRILAFHEKVADPPEIPGRPGWCLGSMGIYIFNIQPLIRELARDARESSAHDFGRNIIPAMLERYRLFAYPFEGEGAKGKGPYWQDIGTLDSYFDASMDLVRVEPTFDLYDKDWPMRTYMPQLPPAKTAWNEEGRQGVVMESLVSNGAVISGSSVKRCILGPGAKVNSYCSLEGVIMFDYATIGRRAKIRKAIIDKGAVVPEDMVIGYDPDQDRMNFVVSEGGVVVVPKGWSYMG